MMCFGVSQKTLYIVACREVKQLSQAQLWMCLIDRMAFKTKNLREIFEL